VIGREEVSMAPAVLIADADRDLCDLYRRFFPITVGRSKPPGEDLCVAERVERALRATGYPPLRAVEVSVCGQLVILRGRVPSYYMKQFAQAAALALPGVRELRNDVEVVRS
jgi:osmotically-inducible protein OsmY